MSGILIRQAEERDLDNVVDACIAEGWMAFAQKKQAFFDALKSSAFIVAYDGDTFAGYARAVSDGVITTYLCEILIAKDYRRRGIGRELVEHIRQIFPLTRIDLISDADDFYKALGFRPLGTGFRKTNN